ncbi:unnamed protein product, partial [Rotaria magnacalcarata]
MTSSALPINDFPTIIDDMHLEIFCLIWLDLNTSAKEKRDTEQKLRSIINHLKKFQDVKQCQQYIEERSHKERIIMIVSGRLGREIVPSIHELRQVISIYVYCMDKEGNKKWADKFAKVKAVVVELDELVSRIKADHKIQKMVEEPLSINIFTSSTDAGKSTTHLNGQFVFSQLLIDCLLRLKYTSEDKNELIHIFKQQYEGNSVELSNLREFQQNYSFNNVLWWYTRESFFYKTLNAALRKQDIHMIYLFREYISDIHRQLKNYQAKDCLRVYRSQMISSDELQTLKQYCNQFISVNSFFSTSIDKRQALSFLNTSDGTNNLEPVLFQIDADPKIVTTKPFANISACSEFSGESEVIFMLGSIFRLKSVDHNNDDQVWIIQMSLCSENEHQLKYVLMNMRQQFGSGETNLHTFGKVLWEMGKFDLAEKYFLRMLEQLSPNDPLLADLYQDLGKLASYAGDLDKSMEWRQKAIALKTSNTLISRSNDDKNSHASAFDAKKCRAYGRGIQPTGLRTGDVAEFRVITKHAGEGIMKASVTAPDGLEVPCRVTKVHSTTYECGYVPNRIGSHTVSITYGGAHIPKSPFPVHVGTYKDSRICAFGPGLEGGIIGFPADFVVETNGETGSLGFAIEGPSHARLELKDNGDGSANVRYWPTKQGEYAVHILSNEEDIPHSPFMAWIETQGNFDSNKVKAYGPGLEPSGQIIDKPTEFTIDTHNAGEATLRVQAMDQEYQPIDVHVRDNGNSTFTCRYTPRNSNRHCILIDYGGVATPNSPFRVWPTEPSNPAKVRVYGPGVERGVKMNIPTHFTVDCKEAGP